MGQREAEVQRGWTSRARVYAGQPCSKYGAEVPPALSAFQGYLGWARRPGTRRRKGGGEEKGKRGRRAGAGREEEEKGGLLDCLPSGLERFFKTTRSTDLEALQ